MRPLWKGAMTFGLVYIPVKMYTATARKDIRFNMLHKKCHTPIRYQKYCPHCEGEVKIDPVYFDRTYYLAPAEGGQKVYELLRRAMDESGRVGIARVTIRSKETLACVRVAGVAGKKWAAAPDPVCGFTGG